MCSQLTQCRGNGQGCHVPQTGQLRDERKLSRKTAANGRLSQKEGEAEIRKPPKDRFMAC